jgi:glycosyltransferase involved in cell wall biosynthesis
MHGRPKVSEFFIKSFYRLRDYARSQDVEIGLVAVVTKEDEQSQAVCLANQIPYIKFPNRNPGLGAKWNRAVEAALERDAIYTVICGDDDILTNGWLDAVLPHMKKDVPFGGVDSAYFVDGENRAIYVKYPVKKILGSGCFIRTDILRHAATWNMVKWNAGVQLKETGFVYDKHQNKLPASVAEHLHNSNLLRMGQRIIQLYDDAQNKALDHRRDLVLAVCGYAPYFIETEKPTIFCPKTSQQVWSFQQVKAVRWAKECAFEDAISVLTGDEIVRLNELYK